MLLQSCSHVCASYNRTTVKEPSMKEALKNVSVDDMQSVKFAAHAYRVFARLKSLLGILDVDGVLREDLAHLKAQHVGRGAKPAYFKVRCLKADHPIFYWVIHCVISNHC